MDVRTNVMRAMVTTAQGQPAVVHIYSRQFWQGVCSLLQRGRRCRVAVTASLPWVECVFLALGGAICYRPIVLWTPAMSHNGNIVSSGAVHSRQPSSHELGDRSVRAGAEPSQTPVRESQRCVTVLTQEFSQDSAVAWPESFFHAPARLGEIPETIKYADSNDTIIL